MPVLSKDESRPHLEPVAEIAVPTLFESQEYLNQVLDTHPELHDMLDSSTKASMLSNIFARRVRPRFADIGLNWQQTGRMQHGNVVGAVGLRFKKLTTDLHSMNVPTERQAKIYHQENIPGIVDLTQVTFGYIPDLIARTIAGIFFICPNGWRSNHWTWSLLGGGGEMNLFGGGVEPIDPNVYDQSLDVIVSINQSDAEHA